MVNISNEIEKTEASTLFRQRLDGGVDCWFEKNGKIVHRILDEYEWDAWDDGDGNSEWLDPQRDLGDIEY